MEGDRRGEGHLLGVRRPGCAVREGLQWKLANQAQENRRAGLETMRWSQRMLQVDCG